MDCLEFRRLIGALPRQLPAEAREHREHCPRCAEAHARALGFENILEQAIGIPVPDRLADEILLRQITVNRTRRSVRLQRLWQIAAGVAMAIGISTIWLLVPNNGSLAALAIEHIHHEPVALLAHPLISESETQHIFTTMGLPLTHPPSKLTYLKICPLGNHRSLHMVMQKPMGAVTVLLVPGLDIKRRNFERQGMVGRELSLDKGALVMIAHNDHEFDSIESDFSQAFSNRSDSAAGSL